MCLVLSAGSFAIKKFIVDKFVVVKLPSGQLKKIFAECYATIGKVSNSYHNLTIVGKAGINVLKGKRNKVSGTAMNAKDHPHGGGEGNSPLGRHPSSRTGVKKFVKTRKKRHKTNVFNYHD